MALSDAARARRAAQRRTARQLKRGERPLGGEYQKRYVSALRKQARDNFRKKLGHLPQYNEATMRRGIDRQQTIDEIIWTINADTDSLRAHAGTKAFERMFEGDYRNPWWYHTE